jgi:hypothetical protein
MKVEDCIVAVEPRSLGGCLDLAFVFSREFAVPLSRLWLLCALPSCMAVALLSSLLTRMLLPSLLVFAVFSAIFGSLMVACVGPQVFGVPMSIRSAGRVVAGRLLSWMLLTGALRFFQLISGFCFIVPSGFVTAYAGHLPEVLLLEQTPVRAVMGRLSWLNGAGGYSRNLARALTLFVYWGAMSLGLFLLLDLLLTALCNRPVLLLLARAGRPVSDFRSSLIQLIQDDPVFLTTLQAAIWLPFPIIRLTWFFCYLDQRIRNECWDLQLHVRTEAIRLEGSGR